MPGSAAHINTGASTTQGTEHKGVETEHKRSEAEVRQQCGSKTAETVASTAYRIHITREYRQDASKETEHNRL